MIAAWWFLIIVYIAPDGEVTHTTTFNRYRSEEACQLERASYTRRPGLLPQGVCIMVPG